MVRDSLDRELFDAVCDKCKKKCQLPFKPRAGKPVYCRECYKHETKNKSFFG